MLLMMLNGVCMCGGTDILPQRNRDKWERNVWYGRECRRFCWVFFCRHALLVETACVGSAKVSSVVLKLAVMVMIICH